jgi:hypothetical protein
MIDTNGRVRTKQGDSHTTLSKREAVAAGFWLGLELEKLALLQTRPPGLHDSFLKQCAWLIYNKDPAGRELGMRALTIGLRQILAETFAVVQAMDWVRQELALGYLAA